MGKKVIACFVSPHGYGHATRASAVMAAIHHINPSVHFEIFTTVPVRLFEETLTGAYAYHYLLTDVGFVQQSPVRVDIEKTIAKLNFFLPFHESMLSELARTLEALGCEMVVCDIAPLGIAVAHKAEIPSILVENFTWDWLYQWYADYEKPFKKHVEYLSHLFDSADHHIQAEPVCFKKKTELICPPISRKAKTKRKKIREMLLTAQEGCKMITITMGGTPNRPNYMESLSEFSDVLFVIPGTGKNERIAENVLMLPSGTDIFHPDLICASDAVIGKVGYSTLAELYHSGVPFGYIARPDFRESDVLVGFIKKNMSGLAIASEDFDNGKWEHFIPALLDIPITKPELSNGADTAAAYINGLL